MMRPHLVRTAENSNDGQIQVSSIELTGNGTFVVYGELEQVPFGPVLEIDELVFGSFGYEFVYKVAT
jgi:hypothetical protein